MKITRKFVTLIITLLIVMSTFAVPASAAETLVHGIGFVNASNLRLRRDPSTSSSVLATANNRECVVVTGKAGQWYKVIYNLVEGYMHESYLKVSAKENAELGNGTVTGSGVNLRSGPSTFNRVVSVASKGDKCYIIGINDGWYKVIYKDQICYIRSDFVELEEIPYENQASSNSPKYFRGGKSIGALPMSFPQSNASTAPQNTSPTVSEKQIITEAQKYLGCPYMAGGSSPSGFDCSGFVYYVLKQVGLSPARTPAAQFNQGTAVSKDALQAGDIVFFCGTYGSGITHVGIYAGNGQFIHAPNSRNPVSYNSLTSGYWAEHYYGARRVA